LPVRARKPDWLTAGVLRLLALCLFIVLVEMLRPRLSPGSAGVVALVGGLIMLAGAATLLDSSRRLAARLRFLPASQRTAESLLLLLRQTGLPLLGLAFFLLWTFIDMALWWFDPHNSFTGLGR
jgi:hypothetical protein